MNTKSKLSLAALFAVVALGFASSVSATILKQDEEA